ncbi:hypothetical protein JYQ62_19440 [Nostoc sp. UHCC 0702]|nr:hypothetical protein JYQ62_19440 [Nostoc sp. UHCC 0702]
MAVTIFVYKNTYLIYKTVAFSEAEMVLAQRQQAFSLGVSLSLWEKGRR